MGIPVHDGTNVVFCGDSLTFQGWFSSAQSQVGGTNLLVDQLSPIAVRQWPGVAGSAVANATGSVGSVSAIPLGGQINAINSGHPQKQIADALANINAWLLSLEPQVLVLEFGRNDVAPPLAPFTPTTLVNFRASYDAVLDQTLSAFPSCAIVCVSILCNGELWAAGPVWNNFFDPSPSNPSYTPSIAQFNAEIQASCIAHGGTYVDPRAPLLAAEAATNTPAPGVAAGVYTQDGTHPNAAGQLIMSDAVVPAFSFS